MILATMALAGAGMMGATFDATDLTPEYQTGIQNVYAVADDGTEVFVPVFSLPECEDEDGTGDPCVWNASVRGNGIGQSYIQLGTEENRIFADVTDWAAEILVDQTAVQSVQVVEPVQAIEPVEVPVQAITPVVPAETVEVPVKAVERVQITDWGYDISDQEIADIQAQTTYDGCFHEDGSGQPGDQDFIWVSDVMGNGNGTRSILYSQGSNAVEMTNAEAHAKWNGINNNPAVK